MRNSRKNLAGSLRASGAVLGLALLAGFAGHGDSELDSLRQEVRDLARKVEAGSEHGSKTMHFHGYGELHYNQPLEGDAQLDFHRFVLGWGHEWNDRWRLDAEIDMEHNFSEPELEYAYVEYDMLPALSLRAGALLLPVGPLNEFHEPPLFYSVERPYLEKNIIPTSWTENGLGLAGQAAAGQVGYRLYLVSGLDAAGKTPGRGFSDTSGLRAGRSGGVESQADDLALVGRLEWRALQHLTLGGSAYRGAADQDKATLGDVNVTILETDVRYQNRRLDLKGEFVNVSISSAAQLSALSGKTIGETLQGWLLEAGVHLLDHEKDDARDVVAFLRREDFDTNKDVPAAFARNPRAEQAVWTVGLAYYPIPKVAFKTDVELWEDGRGDHREQFNLGLAFMY